MPPMLMLLQAREPGDPMREHEHLCFAERSGLPREHIVPHDLLAGMPTPAALRRCDGLLIGGSGSFYVSKRDLPTHDAFMGLLREVVVLRKPTFASCFGYQSLVEALGGEVVHDPPRTEVGTFTLTLTEAGRGDPLFGALPATFTAQQGHKDRAHRHPPGLDNLAQSERAPLQALRVPGAAIWATQFHPELDRRTNLERFDRYLEGYAAFMTDEERAEARRGFAESPEASSLLARFVALVFG